ncbi:MAG TPA: hypothetical protein VIQ02_07105 [Jiangellaceae bacterium]
MGSHQSTGRRHHTCRAGMSIVLATALFSVASPASAATWAPVPSPNTQFHNVLWGVDALSANSAWVVGRADTNTIPINRPVIERWDGSRWRNSASPLPPGGGELRDVDAISSTNAWAVGFTGSSNGYNTLTERWNGSSWNIVPSPSVSAQNYLVGVKTLSANDAWAIGSHNVPGNLAFSTLTMRWNGSAWSIVPSPDTPSFENHLNAIDGTSPNDMWAVGHTQNGDYSVKEPLILHWDGSAWSIVPSPTALDASLEGVVALASNDVWAVGSMFSLTQFWHVPFALHWDGQSWTNVAIPSPTPQGGRLFGVAALSPTKVYAVGQGGNLPSLVMRWNGQSWATETTPTTGTVWDAAAVGPGTVWAVGQRGNPNVGVGRTFILRTTNG